MATIKPNFYEQQAHEKAAEDAAKNREAFYESLRQSGLPYDTAMERLRQYDEVNSVPDVPVSATTDTAGTQVASPTSATPEPQKPQGYGDYSWYGDWVNTHFNSLTNEERARRERAAYISSGVANLGKAFGALGNMFMAQHGAPAQKPVEVADADKRVDAFREYADKERNAYLVARTQRQKLIEDAYDKEWNRWATNAKIGTEAAYRQRRLALDEQREKRLSAKLAIDEYLADPKVEKTQAEAAYIKARAARLDSMTPHEIDALIALIAQRYASAANLNSMAANRGATEETVYEYERDANGNIKLGPDFKPVVKGKTKRKKPVGGGSGGGKKQLPQSPQGGGKKQLP